uniref:CNNM transmembrane domain-containing protein n=1 Tax=Arcella intermedia TaxID=1963864 RepID=A0A6B2L466_9EUKA
MMSGLTIGLMGLDITTLDILSRSGDAKQKVYAKRILPLLKRHHLLLVTLLFMNALAMESLPIFLEKLVSPVLAVMVSVTLILLFGEIVPQALCSRYGLAIGGNLTYVVWVLIVLCFPVAWPIGKLLDIIIGTEHGTFFKRTELKQLIDLHGKKGAKENSEKRLSPNEIAIIKGALDLKTKKALDVMTPLESIFMLNVDHNLNEHVLQNILDSGHSRIPVYQDNKEHIVGMLLVKNLLSVDASVEPPISSLELVQLQQISQNTPLYDVLNLFQQGRHMAVVVDEDQITTLGIITLEAVIEELMQKEIRDETDKKHNKKAKQIPNIQEELEEINLEEPKEPFLDNEIDTHKAPKINLNASPKKEKVIDGAKNLKHKIVSALKVEKPVKYTKAPFLTAPTEKENDAFQEISLQND